MNESLSPNFKRVERHSSPEEEVLSVLNGSQEMIERVGGCLKEINEITEGEAGDLMQRIDQVLRVSDRAKSLLHDTSEHFVGLLTAILSGVEDVNALKEFIDNLELVALSQDLAERTGLAMEVCVFIVGITIEYKLSQSQTEDLTKVFHYITKNGKDFLSEDVSKGLSGDEDESGLLRDFYQSVAIAAVLAKAPIKDLVNVPFEELTYGVLSSFVKKYDLKVSGFGVCGVASITKSKRNQLLAGGKESEFTPEERERVIDYLGKDFEGKCFEAEKLAKLASDSAVSPEEKGVVEEAYANSLAAVIAKANSWCAVQGMKPDDCYIVDRKLSKTPSGTKLTSYLEKIEEKAGTICKSEYFNNLIAGNIENCFYNDELSAISANINNSFAGLGESQEIQSLLGSLNSIRPGNKKGQELIADMAEDTMVRLADSLVSGILATREKLEATARLIRVEMASGSTDQFLNSNPVLANARMFKLGEALNKVTALLKWGPSPLSDIALNVARMEASRIKGAIKNRNLRRLKDDAIIAGGIVSIIGGATAAAMIIGKLSARAGAFLFGTGAQEVALGRAVGVLATNMPRVNAIGRGVFTTAGLSLGGVAGGNATAYGLNQILGEEVFPVVKTTEEFLSQWATAFVSMGTMSIIAKGANSASSFLSQMQNPIAHKAGLIGEGVMKIGGRAFSPATWFEKGKKSGTTFLKEGGYIGEFAEELAALPGGPMADFFQAGRSGNLLGMDFGKLRISEDSGSLVYHGNPDLVVKNLRTSFDQRRGDMEINLREDGVVEVDFIGQDGSGKFGHYEIQPAFEGLTFDRALEMSRLNIINGESKVSSMNEMRGATDTLTRNGFVFQQTKSGVVTATHLETGQSVDIVLDTKIMNQIRTFNEKCEVAANDMFMAIDNFVEGDIDGALAVQLKVAAFIGILASPGMSLAADGQYDVANDFTGIWLMDGLMSDGGVLGTLFVANAAQILVSGASSRVKSILNPTRIKNWLRMGDSLNSEEDVKHGNRFKKLSKALKTLVKSNDVDVETQARALEATLKKRIKHVQFRLSSWRHLFLMRSLNQTQINSVFDGDGTLTNPGLQNLMANFEAECLKSPVDADALELKARALTEAINKMPEITKAEKIEAKGVIIGLMRWLLLISMFGFSMNKINNVFKGAPPSADLPLMVNQPGNPSQVKSDIGAAAPLSSAAPATQADMNWMKKNSSHRNP